MATKSKSQVVSWMGVALGIVHILRKEVQKLGGTDEDVRKLVTSEGEGILAEFAKKLVCAVSRVFSFIPIFDRDMSREGWKMERDTENRQCDQGDFVPELVEFLKKGESYITSEEMEERAKKRKDLSGQRHLEGMLRNQERIPAGWREFVLVAPKTVWVDSYGSRCVPSLFWDGLRWCPYFYWFSSSFDRYCRFVRLSK